MDEGDVVSEKPESVGIGSAEAVTDNKGEETVEVVTDEKREEMVEAVTDNKGEETVEVVIDEKGEEDKKDKEDVQVTEMEEDKRDDDGNVEALDMYLDKSKGEEGSVEEVNKSEKEKNRKQDTNGEGGEETESGKMEEEVGETTKIVDKQEITGEGGEDTDSGKMEEEVEETTEVDEKQKTTGEGEKEETEFVKIEVEAEVTTNIEEKQETTGEGVGEETEGGKMEEEADTTMTEKVEEKVDSVKQEGEKLESEVEKGTKKRPRTKGSARKRDADSKKEPETKKEKEPKTPSPSTIDRPVRERKSVERLVSIIEKDVSKEFHVEKGRGTALKDIPNVMYNLSRKKNEDTFKFLYTMLFGRRGKASQIKSNISRFSGLILHDNEEKQKMKVKEKLDKCVKEKLVDLCDVLDIPISKATIKKEDMITKLLDFLVEPYATTSELLAEKEQSSSKKRKRAIHSTPGSSTPSKGSSKAIKKKTSESEDQSEEKQVAHEEEGGVNGVPGDRSDDEIFEPESDEDKGKQKRVSAKSSEKKVSAKKAKTEKAESTLPRKRPAKSPSHPRKKDDTSVKKSSGKKKDESIKETTSKTSESKESIGKKILKVKGPKEEKVKPSDDELRTAISEILKEVDFNTATFTDIMKLLVKRFDMDLAPMKPSIKSMVQDELTKLAEAERDDEEEDDDDAGKDEKKPSSQGVKA